MRTYILESLYLASSVLFILGLKGLTSPEKARRGMNYAAVGMVLAIVGTLLHHEIVRYDWIIAGLLLGSAIGIPIGLLVPMTAMPQRIAISHMFGALAATLVGVAHYYVHGATHGNMVALGFEVLFGSLTITGSFMAFAKLQELIPGRPMTYRGQNIVNISCFFAAVAIFIYLIIDPTAVHLFYAMIGLGLLIGVMMVLPIGGADMPVVISLLNAFTGLAVAASGFTLNNFALIVAGTLVGASGSLLTKLMSDAMGRSIGNILFGAFGQIHTSAAGVPGKEGRSVRTGSIEDLATLLAYSQRVIIVPGYGLAVAQAQHAVRELAQLLEKRGVEVNYAIHPVAGRMPGHMNVLLAEANVPYEQLKEMDEINDEFKNADVVLVVGANDVVNPAARSSPGSPIYGMPILNADQAKNIVFMKRSMRPGFAGIDNDLLYDPKTLMLFGVAKDSLTKLVNAVKAA